MTTLVELPATTEQLLSPEWLTRSLSDLAPGDTVIEAHEVDRSKTIASKVRFETVIADADGKRRVRAYCAKGILDDGNARPGGFVVETRFYRDIAPRLGLRTPTAYYAGIDETTGRALMILDDVVAEGGNFLSVFSGYSVDTVRSALAELATLHAATWGERRLRDYQWLRPNMVPSTGAFPTDLLQRLLDDGRGPDLPGYLRDAELVKEGMRRVDDGPSTCVIHGDAHSGNAYLDAEGRFCWLDWQITHIGHWATDVSYHICTALDPETRRDHEQHLLRGYLDELARLGAEAPAWEQAWDAYRSHIAYGYYLWAITQIHSRLVVVEHIPRLGAAIVDHDTFARLGLTS